MEIYGREQFLSLFGEDHIEVCETHISRVYLGSSFAWKFKKAVVLPFLDYSTLEARRQACEAEIAVNRPFAPGMYLGVWPVYKDHNGILTWKVLDEPIDFAVKMLRYPRAASLDRRVQAQDLSSSERHSLIVSLSAFVRDMPSTLGPFDELFRTWEAHILENEVSLIHSQTTLGEARTPWASLCQRQRMFLRLHKDLLMQRFTEGKVRLGHGDLKPEHIILLNPPVLMDAIEFNPAFRQLDQADELSFLELELTVLGARDLGREIRAEVLQSLNDHPDPKLLAFYRAYRACVRAKVLMTRALQLEGEGRESLMALIHCYAAFAEKANHEMLPLIAIVVVGPMGSGKTTLARTLSDKLGIAHIESDRVRRELFGESTTQENFGQGRYSEAARLEVYDALLSEASRILQHEGLVIIDASFTLDSAVARLESWADRHQVRLCVLRCFCRSRTAQERIHKRGSRGYSEGRPELQAVHMQGAHWAFDLDEVTALDTERPLSELVESSLQAVGHMLQRAERQIKSS